MEVFKKQQLYLNILLELSADYRLRADLNDIIASLPSQKQEKIRLSLETIQNKYFTQLLNKILYELKTIAIQEPDIKSIEDLTQVRIDEILDYNLESLPITEQIKINKNINTLDNFIKNIEDDKY